MIARFRSIKQAISYCGLCGEERARRRRSMRTPLSKQRNKHIQRVLVEAAKLAPRQNHELALIYERRSKRAMPIEQRSRWPGRWSPICLLWTEGNGTS